MNAGFFTAHAVAVGFAVVAFEPQPACIAMMHKSLNASSDGLQSRVRFLNAALGTDGGTLSMHTGERAMNYQVSGCPHRSRAHSVHPSMDNTSMHAVPG